MAKGREGGGGVRKHEASVNVADNCPFCFLVKCRLRAGVSHGFLWHHSVAFCAHRLSIPSASVPWLLFGDASLSGIDTHVMCKVALGDHNSVTSSQFVIPGSHDGVCVWSDRAVSYFGLILSALPGESCF